MAQLIKVQSDGVYFPVRRKGRFAMELQAAKSPAHRQAAARRAWDYFRKTMALKGFESLGGPVEMRGPLPHLDVSEDFTADPGPLSRPDPQSSPETIANWERAERARSMIAKKIGETPELIDIVLVGEFRQRATAEFHTAAPQGHLR